MENSALVIIHLVPEANKDELVKLAKIFKIINLTASFDENCTCHLVDEDETPEISKAGVGTLFVSFTIWKSTSDIDVFKQKLNLISEINLDEYTFSSWKISENETPVLYEGLGRIWVDNDESFSEKSKSAFFPELFKSFGRNWLMGIFGPTEDLFVYDRWETRNRVLVEPESNKTEDVSSDEFTIPVKEVVSFFKKPFGQNNDSSSQNNDSKEITPEKKLPEDNQDDINFDKIIREFDDNLRSFNTQLNNYLANYFQFNYARLSDLVNWTQRVLDIINQQFKTQTNNNSIKVRDYIQAEEKKWRKALEMFTSQRDAQYDFETRQAEIQRNIYKKDFDEQNKRNKLMFDTNNELLSIHREQIANSGRSFQNDVERWKRTFFGS